jgi:hypothetical protein
LHAEPQRHAREDSKLNILTKLVMAALVAAMTDINKSKPFEL